MITPSCSQITALAEGYDFIPVCKEVYADVATPITLLRRISEVSPYVFLLESVEGGETWGRYSFLGYDPVMRVSCKRNVVTIQPLHTGQAPTVVQSSNPCEILREILGQRKAPHIEGLPPFAGGFVGYFSYGMVEYAEPTLNIRRGNGKDFDLMLFEKVIAYDHLKQKIAVLVNMKTDNLMENYGKACGDIETIVSLIGRNTPLPKSFISDQPTFKCNVAKSQFCEMVEKTKEYIRNGDIFQAVISRQFESPYKGSLLNAYRVLRTTNPSPYMVYLKLDEDEIISTSPETLVRLQNGRLTTFPVAGSRPRGATREEDLALERELLADEKELSEHNMLVDLGRNDLGRISRFSTVQVTQYKAIHRYSKIMHICSQVEGDIREEYDACDAIQAVLPAGTLSGAPKVRACEIIEELETDPRGVYGGALGYLDFTGNMDTCIAIRMAVKQDGNVTVQAGGGIVADSIPENEYEESANKAQAVIQAIQNAREVND